MSARCPLRESKSAAKTKPKIVEVSDTLRFYKADIQNSTYVAEFSLTPFRYISQYTNNLTI